jgi:hypothetical protein
MRRSAVVAIALVSFVMFTAEVRRRSVRPAPNAPIVLDARRSFSVTDQAILDGFSFERVLNAIVERSATTTTSLELIRQLFDTQNPKPGLVAAGAPHCDDFLVDGKPAFNGFARGAARRRKDRWRPRIRFRPPTTSRSASSIDSI